MSWNELILINVDLFLFQNRPIVIVATYIDVATYLLIVDNVVNDKATMLNACSFPPLLPLELDDGGSSNDVISSSLLFFALSLSPSFFLEGIFQIHFLILQTKMHLCSIFVCFELKWEFYYFSCDYSY